MSSLKKIILTKGKSFLSFTIISAMLLLSNNFIITLSAKELSVLNKFTYGVAINDNQIPPSTNLVEGPWVMGELNEGNTRWLSEFNKAENQNKTPLIYMYVVAGMARSDWGLQDCNVGASPEKTLCKNGANYFRQNSAKIESKYNSIISQIKNIIGQERELAIHIEPDFYQYSEQEQYDGGITAEQGSREMNKWTASFKSKLPNSSLILDVAAWNKDLRGWSSKFQNFDYAGLVGKRFSPNGDGNVDGKTFKQISKETGKKLIINDSHGPGGWWMDFNYDWAIKETVKDRYNDGVIAVIMPPNNLNFLDKLQKINSQNTPERVYSLPKLLQTPLESSGIINSSSSLVTNTFSSYSSLSSLYNSLVSESVTTKPSLILLSKNQNVSSSSSNLEPQYKSPQSSNNYDKSTCENNSAFITLARTSKWNNGYTGIIKVKNNSKSRIIDWSVTADIPDNSNIKDVWNIKNNNNIFTPQADWNKYINPNEEVEVGGFNVSFEKQSAIPTIKCNTIKANI